MIEILTILFSKKLITLFFIGFVLSIIIIVIIQKIKLLSYIKTDNQIWFINLFLSFTIGILFSIFFYNLNILEALWVSLFSFILSNGIYKIIKKQKIINYTPTSLDETKEDKLEISKKNLIDRNDKS